MPRYVIGIDQSTSSSTAVLLNVDGLIVASNTQLVTRHTPSPGWVEQDATELWLATLTVLRAVVQDARISPLDIEGIGIANQRETLVVWNAATGEPIGRAIGWQDRRTLPLLEAMSPSSRTGLERANGMLMVTNAAGPKLDWLLRYDRQVQRGVATGSVLCGTIDSWLIWKLSGQGAHVSDHSNASVTGLQDARTLSWSEPALAAFGIPRDVLPKLRETSGVIGTTGDDVFAGVQVPLAACVGDQQAATFGQGCVRPGMAKTSYGAGSFTAMNVGERYIPPGHGAFSPVLWSIAGVVDYGLEYMIDDAGAVLDWLRDGLGIITEARDAEALSQQVPDTGGLYFVPALGAPATVASASRERVGGLLVGLTHNSTRQHIARAALEAIAYQTCDAHESIRAASGLAPDVLRVDGAGARNDFLLQFQADILGIPVERPLNLRTTPTGAAYLAGIAVGFWDGTADVEKMWRIDKRFEPRFSEDQRQSHYGGWRDALSYTGQLTPLP